jgi:hypothetical protein
MPTKPKQDPVPEPDKLEALRAEIIEILEEYLNELNERADKNPGEHNVEPIRNARHALLIFKPDVPNLYS